jgi:Subtilase family
MKRVFFILAFFGFVNAFGQNMPGKLTPVEGRFLVLLDSSVEKKVTKALKKGKTDQFKRNAMANEKAQRDAKTAKVKSFIKGLGITDAEIDQVFVDAGVGLVVKNINENKLKRLREAAGINAVSQDFIVQFADPIMQSDPIMQADPIMQLFSDPIMQADPIMQSDAFDIDTTRMAPKAIVRAGGPVDGKALENRIWILDTGVDPDQVQLNVIRDTAISKSFADGETDIRDNNGHGTHCAGIAAASSSGKGVVGVSAGAKIAAVKVLTATGNGSWTSVIAGLNHVSINAMEGDVVNMSFGASDPTFTEGTNPLLTKAVKDLGEQGLMVVMSAGNSASNANMNLPGLISGKNIFTVAAMDNVSQFASYSNFGMPPVDFIVTGSRIISLWPNNRFRMLSGTSMAAAVMSGILHASRGKMPATTGKVMTSDKGIYNIAVINR